MAKKLTTYYAYVRDGQTIDNPQFVFRHVRPNGYSSLDMWDAAAGAWVDRWNCLAPHIFKGEPGAEPIAETQAAKLIGARALAQR